MFAVFKKCEISSMSVVIPQKEINIYDELQYYENSIKKVDRIRKIAGFHKRRVIDSNTTSADLAIVAAETLIRDKNIDRDKIDFLIFVVQSPDYLAPSTSYYIHSKLGLSQSCPCTDINQGCAGWVYGVFMAHFLVESGICKNVLLLCADTPSKGIDVSNRYTAPIFGDGGVATFIQSGSKETYFNIDTLGNGFEFLVSPFSATRFYDTDTFFREKLKKTSYKTEYGSEYFLDINSSYMDGMEVFNFTINVVPKNIKALLEYTKNDIDDIEYLCLHQANKQIITEVGRMCGFSEDKVPYYAFENFGNNTMCSIPTTIATLPENSKKDKLLCSGFGNGLVCASVLLDISHIKKIPLYEYEEMKDKYYDFPAHFNDKNLYIQYWQDKFNKNKEN